MNLRAQTLNGLFKHGLMFSFGVGKVHYHTLKSDIIAFLIFLFIWHTILFIQQHFKTCPSNKKTRTQHYVKWKQQGFRYTKRKIQYIIYVYFHHFHVLWKIDSYIRCHASRSETSAEGQVKARAKRTCKFFFNWNINYDIIFKIKTIWQNKYPTQLWPRARPESKPDVFDVCISNLAYFFKRIEESRTKLRKPAYL